MFKNETIEQPSFEDLIGNINDDQDTLKQDTHNNFQQLVQRLSNKTAEQVRQTPRVEAHPHLREAYLNEFFRCLKLGLVLGAALAVFQLINLAEGREPVEDPEDLDNVLKILGFVLANLSAAGTMNVLSALLKLREDMSNGISLKEAMKNFISSTSLGTAKGFVIFSLFTLQGTIINLAHLTAGWEAMARTGATLTTVIAFDYLEKNKHLASELSLLFVAFLSILYGGNIADFTASVLADSISPIALQWVQAAVGAGLPATAGFVTSSFTALLNNIPVPRIGTGLCNRVVDFFRATPTIIPVAPEAGYQPLEINV